MHVGDTDGVSEGTPCGGEAEGRHSPTQLPTPQEAAGTLWRGLARPPIPLTAAGEGHGPPQGLGERSWSLAGGTNT